MGAQWRLSGFGDEIDPRPEVQVAVLQSLGARHIEIRSAWNENVIDLSGEQLTRLDRLLQDAGMAVSAIASPVGKVDVNAEFDNELDRLRRAVRAAHHLNARYIRIFSFYCGDVSSTEAARGVVLERMRAFAELAEDEHVVLVHENEKDIYGDTPRRVLDIIESVGSSALKVAWDSANFVQVGVRPYADAFPLLGSQIEYLQIKDALLSSGEVVASGGGDGDIREVVRALKNRGFDGFVSLEPHLATVSRLGGFSGPWEFGVAARAFRTIADEEGVELV